MDALATVLVRSTTEVVAVAASGPNIVAIQDETQPAESDPDENRYHSQARISKIAGIVNPRTEYTYKFPDGTHCMLISDGQSHFKLVPNADVRKLFLDIPYVFNPAFQGALPMLRPKLQGGRSVVKPYPHRG
jgi:hypothetical protein